MNGIEEAAAVPGRDARSGSDDTVPLILGTAGHIDHGKTALVKALTGVDTDRLKEEKERGITVDLGFAELPVAGGPTFGVVDVPGHEGFIRNMVAGATGVDVVLMVVAADEGVMPQTREHLSIVRLLGVQTLVVALTKADLVQEEWLELVRQEVAELLADTPFRKAPMVATSSETGRGLNELRDTLGRAAGQVGVSRAQDLVRLPVDRVFTVRGTGTVVTGTLWSGTLKADGKVRVVPGGLEARIRGLQVHGASAATVRGGRRVAVALAGSDVSRDAIERGQTLVDQRGWEESWMLTIRMSVLEGPGWQVERGQRVRVHLGTAEVMARATTLEGDIILPGHRGWVQLRLEEPVAARVGDRLIVRSYSPVTTIAGGVVVESHPPKRAHLDEGEGRALEVILDGGPAERLGAVLNLAGWSGAPQELLPVLTGDPPDAVESALEELHGVVRASAFCFPASVRERAREVLVASIREYHEGHPLKPGAPLEELRQALPGPRGEAVAQVILEELAAEGVVEMRGGCAVEAGFQPTLSQAQEEIRSRLVGVYEEAGLAPPGVADLPADLGPESTVRDLLGLLEARGDLVTIAEDVYMDARVLADAVERVQEVLGGREGLGPSDFREALPVTRKHLIPLLTHLDGMGVTVRNEDGRTVPGP